MFWKLFGKFTLLFTSLETGSYHLPSCQCLRVGPTCMYVCMYVQNERVCHGVSYRFWAKMWHPEDLPPRLLETQKNTGGGYISGGQVKYFSEISCLTPPEKIQG